MFTRIPRVRSLNKSGPPKIGITDEVFAAFLGVICAGVTKGVDFVAQVKLFEIMDCRGPDDMVKLASFVVVMFFGLGAGFIASLLLRTLRAKVVLFLIIATALLSQLYGTWVIDPRDPCPAAPTLQEATPTPPVVTPASTPTAIAPVIVLPTAINTATPVACIYTTPIVCGTYLVPKDQVLSCVAAYTEDRVSEEDIIAANPTVIITPDLIYEDDTLEIPCSSY